VHPQRRVYAGGAKSVRGFGESRLGPRVLVVDNPASLLEADSVGGAACTPDEVILATCDASRLSGGRHLTSRPIGGSKVFEANLELRIPVGGDFEIVGFGDMGQVWSSGQPVDPADLEFTPGTGVRYLSPIGPIRVDVGYTFRGSERLSVVTEGIQPFSGTCESDVPDCISVGGMEIPYALTGAITTLNEQILYGDEDSFWSRLQLHLSIGQAF
jgi:outer membrane protein assembly factor BamA